MRKFIVSNLVTLDGFYEGKNRSLDAVFDYFHKDYTHDEYFDFYQAELLRAAEESDEKIRCLRQAHL